VTRRSWVVLSVLSAAVLGGWGSAFASGRVSARSAVGLLRAVAHRAIPAQPGPRLAVAAGDRLPDSVSRALRARFGDYAVLLAVRATNTPRRPSVLHYADVLAERYGPSGLAALALGDSAPDDSATARAASAVGLLAVRAAVVLVAGDGTVRFAAAAEPTPDVMRQLVERALVDYARTTFAGAPRAPAAWQRRLAAVRLTTLAGAPAPTVEALLDSADRVVIFEAHCSACRVRADLELLRRVSGAGPRGSRVVAVFASHYAPLLGEASFDSTRVTPLISSVGGLAPELAYISRDVPQSAPVVLVIEGGRVARVESLDRDGDGAA
jgi:hypothetical protein